MTDRGPEFDASPAAGAQSHDGSVGQVIPDEAVEAAARRLCALAGYDWDQLDVPNDVIEDFHGQLLSQARAILEAAAPHLREAWRDEELDEKAREAKEERADER